MCPGFMSRFAGLKIFLPQTGDFDQTDIGIVPVGGDSRRADRCFRFPAFDTAHFMIFPVFWSMRTRGRFSKSVPVTRR